MFWNKKADYACPYCGSLVYSLPEDGEDCEDCGNTYWTREGQSLFANPLTTVNKVAIDLYRDLLSRGATMQDFVRMSELLEEDGTSEFFDVMWRVSMLPIPERTVTGSSKKEWAIELLRSARSLAEWRAEYCFQTEKDYIVHQKQQVGYMIQEIIAQAKSKRDAPYVLIDSNGCCDDCDYMHGESMLADDAIAMEPLPNKDCSRMRVSEASSKEFPFCICKYA